MKKILTPFLFILSVYANAQKDTLDIQLSDSTAIGAPDGTPVSSQIGAAGGTIVSDDGRVELIFPAGALTTNTTISIQPTANLAPNGVGKSYWFEPSGIQFKKPVQIIFHYTDEEAETCPPDWMSLGIQSKTGKWTFIDYESFDSISKTLKGYMHHFSGASNINDVQLIPWDNQIHVNGNAIIVVSDISRIVSSEKSKTGIDIAILPGSNQVLLYANGVLHGNEETGKIKAQAIPEEYITTDGIKGPHRGWNCTYYAPDIMPKQNPVKISAEIYRTKGKGLRKRIHCYIEVYDEYKVTIIYNSPDVMDPALTDSANFVATIYPDKVEVSDIRNYSPTVGKMRNPSNQCEYKIFTEGCVGTINIEEGDFRDYEISKDYPPEILFNLPKHKKVLLHKFQLICKTKPPIPPEPVTDIAVESPVIEVNFIANGQRQSITYANLHYRILVHRVRKE